MQLDRIAPRIGTEQADLAAILTQQAQQDTDGGGLAGAIRPEEGMHLANANLKIETVERAHAAISLGQPRGAQRHIAHAAGWLLRTADFTLPARQGFIHSSGDCWLAEGPGGSARAGWRCGTGPLARGHGGRCRVPGPGRAGLASR